LFFDLGGNSLLFARVVTELDEQLGIQLHPRELLLLTLGQIAAIHDKSTVDKASVEHNVTMRNIEVFYIEHENEQLFACYHQPNPQQQHPLNVVICNPIGFEYQYAHRSLRKLADMLASEGYPVLRFDYYGCGDSSGHFEQASIAQWLKDITAAVDAIQQKTGCDKTCLIGLRFGATMATLYAGQAKDIQAVVNWDVVLSGQYYLHELNQLQQRMVIGKSVSSNEQHTDVGGEFIGYWFTKELCHELSQLDLQPTNGHNSEQVLFIDSNQQQNSKLLQRYLQELSMPYSYHRHEYQTAWQRQQISSEGLPYPILRSITQWVDEVKL